MTTMQPQQEIMLQAQIAKVRFPRLPSYFILYKACSNELLYFNIFFGNLLHNFLQTKKSVCICGIRFRR